jgi:uncharacterized membrane protein YczE
MITGAVWTVFSVIGLWFGALFTMCPSYGCPSIFSYVGSWILIGIGLAILAIGIALVVMSKTDGRTRVSRQRGNTLEINRMPFPA